MAQRGSRARITRNVNDATVYIDEAGNEGDVAGDAPFGDQLTFAVAGILESAGSTATTSAVAHVRSRLRLRGEVELKSRMFTQKPDELQRLVHELYRGGASTFIELMDKRYFIANNIVTYVLGDGRVDLSCPSTHFLANRFADFLASAVGDEPLLAYARFAKKPDRPKFDAFVGALRAGMRSAEKRVRTASPLLPIMDGVLRRVQSEWPHDDDPSSYERFVQPPDRSPGGHRLGLLPHVHAFVTLCARLNAFVPDGATIHLVHHRQNEFGSLLRDYLSQLETNRHRDGLSAQSRNAAAPLDWDFRPGRFQLSFVDAKVVLGVQAADVIAGFCRRRLDEVIRDAVDARFDGVARLVAEVEPPATVHFTTTDERVASFVGRA